jgi:transcriptional regulator with XRE-family HTH domain
LGVPSGIKQRAVCTQAIRLLREERVKRGLSKYALSAQCGLTQQTISYMELATDLGRPTDSRSQAANSAIEQRLHEALAQQVEVDAQTARNSVRPAPPILRNA